MKKLYQNNIIFIFFFIKFFFAYCCYKNIHKNHKILEIIDEESLKIENINIESLSKESNDIALKTSELKKSIENEINKINNNYEKVIEKMSKSFLEKHEKLLKEENELKEKLEIEVTKAKEKLELYWSEINNSIKINEKINLGIKNLEKEEKNIFKILSYASKINKNKKIMKKLLI